MISSLIFAYPGFVVETPTFSKLANTPTDETSMSEVDVFEYSVPVFLGVLQYRTMVPVCLT